MAKGMHDACIVVGRVICTLKRTTLLDASKPISESTRPQHATTARYVLLHLAMEMTGYTIKAMQRKIERGEWVEGKVWIRAPDGRVLISIPDFEKWVEGR